MYSEGKHWSALFYVYRVLLTSLLHFQKAKHTEIVNNELKVILFNLQVYCKFEYIITIIWLEAKTFGKERYT